MTTYIGSDFHWHHKNIIKHCPDTRSKYETVEKMNEKMIIEWNQIVNPDDTVYMVGDIAFCNAETAAAIMKRLNGKKILIVGNHDTKLIEHREFTDCFESIHHYLEINHNKVKICMMHYPIAHWNANHRGSVMLHGHLHQNDSGLEKYRCRNVGFDYTGKLLNKLDDIITDALKGEVRSHHD